MNWQKHPAPINFRYSGFKRSGASEGALYLDGERGTVEFCLMEGGVLRVRLAQGEGSEENPSRVNPMAVPAAGARATAGEGANWDVVAGLAEVAVDAWEGTFCFTHGGRIVVESSRLPFGVNGQRQIALFDRPEQTPVYGLGEKSGPLDKSGKSYTFWNVDVVADHPHNFGGDSFDPGYVSVPFYISRFRKDWFGVFLDNPYRTFVHAGLHYEEDIPFHPSLGLRAKGESVFALGARQGRMDLYIVPGPTLADVVRRFARLTGVHDMPPMWALGYQQCRWSYMNTDEAIAVTRRLAKERIPTGALWLDIDYMDRFQVFTWNKKTFSAKGRKAMTAALAETGTRLVTIVDPGVKMRPGFEVYDSGMGAGVFCKTVEGQPFVGLVWPGQTVFPDYATETTQEWWAGWIAKWMGEGVDGVWIDMNDPSTGVIDAHDMWFEGGTMPHEAYRNQYADLMARATRAGMLAADPDSRPFILTRSGMSGIQRYAAVWTGDNVSNEAHLRMSIPQSINLALSGISFNGPDVGGFIGNCSAELLETWMLAGALFPFFRNHSCQGTPPQEPWVFGRRTLKLIRSAVNTRAKLLPYLYTLFHEHSTLGDAVMRPLAYEFEGKKFEAISDQFMLGRHLMMAPIIEVGGTKRDVVLPPGWWFDMVAGEWIKGGRTITVKNTMEMIIFVRDGAILPAIDGNAFFPQPDFARLSLHVFCHKAPGVGSYYEDDHLTRGWERGEFNRYDFTAEIAGKNATLEIVRAKHGYPAGAERANVYYYGLAPSDSKPAEVAWPFRSYAAKSQSVLLE